MFTAISNWPPSPTGSLLRNSMILESIGSSTRSRTFLQLAEDQLCIPVLSKGRTKSTHSRNQLAFLKTRSQRSGVVSAQSMFRNRRCGENLASALTLACRRRTSTTGTIGNRPSSTGE
jgi:hypothetical protein